MMRPTRQITIGLLGTSALLFAACGVNEMGAYQSQISDVQVDTSVTSRIALDVAELTFEGAEVTASDAAVVTTESYIVDRLATRLAHRIDHDYVGARFADVMVDDMARGFDWRLVAADQPADTRFLATIEGYGLDIDAFGRANVWYRVRVRGWFLPQDKIIYDQWETFEAPLERYTGIAWHPHLLEPDGQLAERAYNLLLVNDLPDVVMADVFYMGAEEAAADVVAELIDDTYGR